MNEKVKDLVESILDEVNDFIEQSKQTQIKEMLSSGGDIKTHKGGVVFDVARLVMEYNDYTDDVIRRLDDMYMREEITEEELDYVKYHANLD